jgi:hypothetical protein
VSGVEAAFGKVVCGPDTPPGWQRWDWDRFRSATCIAAFGDIACGWGCVAAYGEVRCSTRPWGRCAAAFGEIVCSD